MRNITIGIIVILIVSLVGFGTYSSIQGNHRYLEEIDKEAHSICERANMEYLSHVSGFFKQWKVSCYNNESKTIGEVTFE